MKFPVGEQAREEIRLAYLEEVTLEAHRKAGRFMLSLRCQKGDHRCLNDGVSCLCRCHDR